MSMLNKDVIKSIKKSLLKIKKRTLCNNVNGIPPNMKSNEEKVFKKYLKEGWIVARNGYPDFLMCKPFGKKWIVNAVEVKYGKTTQLRPNQRLVKKMLERAGINYHILRVR